MKAVIIRAIPVDFRPFLWVLISGYNLSYIGYKFIKKPKDEMAILKLSRMTSNLGASFWPNSISYYLSSLCCVMDFIDITKRTQMIPEVCKYVWKLSSLICRLMTTGARARKRVEMIKALCQDWDWDLSTKILRVVCVKNKKNRTLMPKRANPIKALKNKTLDLPKRSLVISEIERGLSSPLWYIWITFCLTLRRMAAAVHISMIQAAFVSMKMGIVPVRLAA